MKYRREIDGLRALAVIPVILFHAGFEGFSGGFVGVDIFFVISGYLITSLIIEEKQAGTFTLSGFYERRARRILPALFLVMLASLPAAWIWLFPADMQNFSQSLVAVATFVANIFFWNTSEYFGPDAELRPLLHTWSLGVEEQFYVLFPMLLLILWGLGKRWAQVALAVLAMASLAAALIGASAFPEAAFFLLPTRAWELLAGALIAFYFSLSTNRRDRPMLSQSASSIGLVLILLAIVVFGDNVDPGLHTLAPVLGACLVILFATPETWVGRLLAGKWVVGIGLISYSAYLWHQPLFAFARHASLEKPGISLMAALAVASLGLAAVSTRYVETPFRDRRRVGRRTGMASAALCMVVLLSAGIAGSATGGFKARFSESQLKILSFLRYDYFGMYRDGKCLLTQDQGYKDFAPECAAADGASGLLIWGDSHAAALSFGLRHLHPGVTQYTASGCPPIMDVDISDRPRCRKINEYVAARLHSLQPVVIYLHANWTRYRNRASAVNVGRTIDYIRQALPSARIVVVGSVPHWYPSLPAALVKRQKHLDAPANMKGATLANLVPTDTTLRAVAMQHGAEFFSAIDALCAHGECQAVVEFGGAFMPMAADYGHLTAGGSTALAAKILQKLK
ncbi:MAG: acyltransferase family protein [Burkholderiales bacterium]